MKDRYLTEYVDNLTRVTAEKERVNTELTMATQIRDEYTQERQGVDR